MERFSFKNKLAKINFVSIFHTENTMRKKVLMLISNIYIYTQINELNLIELN
jgi:hypothetical protein